jgi:hypothetical protein
VNIAEILTLTDGCGPLSKKLRAKDYCWIYRAFAILSQEAAMADQSVASVHETLAFRQPPMPARMSSLAPYVAVSGTPRQRPQSSSWLSAAWRPC